MIRKNKTADPPFFWNTNRPYQPAARKNETDWDYTPKKANRTTSTRDGSRNTARAGLKDGWIRATLIIREENLKKLKELAYWTRKDLKQIADEAITAYLAERESVIPKYQQPPASIDDSRLSPSRPNE